MKQIKLKEQIATSNRYAALETVNKMYGNVTNLKTVSVSKPKTINNMQLGNKIYTEQDRLTTNELQEEINVKTKVRHNLQNPSLTHQQSLLKKKQETYTIPTIVNGHIRGEFKK